ncbi:group IIE secretory phospholipase A2-like [Spea bombifrons]|uniref:group IIE secretory phospholipase A2-like n=1 Tax=Spea bombifrons TaxID=233779 RepID=UPI00234961BD|nr:group IIE secretory phospholipase A2-like [Spea bombifrons]
MATALFIVLCAAVAVASCGLLEFGTMIHEVTGRSAISFYAFYGCHCGYGGYGQPKDQIDWCCHKHDCCFARMSLLGCRPMTRRYHYDFTDGSLTCDSPKNDDCARLVCECDRDAVLCFKQHDDKYSRKYTFYAKKLRCRGPTPACAYDALPDN